MKYTLILFLFGITALCFGQATSKKLKTGADQTELYLPYLKSKKVGMVVNATSIIGNEPSTDRLIAEGISIQKIFAPEHGFRGDYSNGAKIADGIDTKTGISIISLYGKHLKPTPEDLDGLDLLIFDIQDVGARFYTYISTLHYVMEACAENKIELLVLDRPNPNGFYVDGPVLEPEYESFVGMHPVPIVHGMTIGEYAQMINGEGWLANKVFCKLKIIKVANYTHAMPYTLPVKPSPNLNTQQAIYLYPSLCLFEGTTISQGRGTYMPFQVLGSPDLKNKYRFSFRPKSISGMSENPLHLDKDCFGLDLRKYSVNKIRQSQQINLKWLLELYKAYPDKEKFFDTKLAPQIGNFDRLAGTANLKQQIIAGKTEEEIRFSWEPALSQYKLMRKRYLLYP
ncbi:MAG: exo-beta-N-acetylmuramidase NamZ domain-containing protein [Sphingobacteriaceae bacterium]